MCYGYFISRSHRLVESLNNLEGSSFKDCPQVDSWVEVAPRMGLALFWYMWKHSQPKAWQLSWIILGRRWFRGCSWVQFPSQIAIWIGMTEFNIWVDMHNGLCCLCRRKRLIEVTESADTQVRILLYLLDCWWKVRVAPYWKSVGGVRKTSEADSELLSAQLITVSQNARQSVCVWQAYISPEGRQIPVERWRAFPTMVISGNIGSHEGNKPVKIWK